MRANKPISVTLGKLLPRVEQRVASGEYSSASEVIREGLRALDRQEALLDEALRRQVEKSLADRRPSISAQKAFANLRKHMRRAAK